MLIQKKYDLSNKSKLPTTPRMSIKSQSNRLVKKIFTKCLLKIFKNSSIFFNFLSNKSKLYNNDTWDINEQNLNQKINLVMSKKNCFKKMFKNCLQNGKIYV